MKKLFAPLSLLVLVVFIHGCSADDNELDTLRVLQDMNDTIDYSEYDLYSVIFSENYALENFKEQFSDVKGIVYNEITLKNHDITVGVYLKNTRSMKDVDSFIRAKTLESNQNIQFLREEEVELKTDDYIVLRARLGIKKSSTVLNDISESYGMINSFERYSHKARQEKSKSLRSNSRTQNFNIDNIPYQGSSHSMETYTVDYYPSGLPKLVFDGNRTIQQNMEWESPQFLLSHQTRAYEHDLRLNNYHESSLGPGTYLAVLEDGFGVPIYESWSSNFPEAYNDTRFLDDENEVSFTIGCADAWKIYQYTRYFTAIFARPGQADKDNAKLTAVPSERTPNYCTDTFCVFGIDGAQKSLVKAWNIPIPGSINWRRDD